MPSSPFNNLSLYIWNGLAENHVFASGPGNKGERDTCPLASTFNMNTFFMTNKTIFGMNNKASKINDSCIINHELCTIHSEYCILYSEWYIINTWTTLEGLDTWHDLLCRYVRKWNLVFISITYRGKIICKPKKGYQSYEPITALDQKNERSRYGRLFFLRIENQNKP